MQSTYAVPTEVSPLLITSASLVAVGLFCLLGLAISVVAIPYVPAEDFSWVLAHLE